MYQKKNGFYSIFQKILVIIKIFHFFENSAGEKNKKKKYFKIE